MNPYSLEGKSIVVFGASSGIGQVTSHFLSTLGARLILSGRNMDKLMNTLDNTKNPQDHVVKTLDLQYPDQVKDWLKEVVNETGNKLDGMVYSAGIHYYTPLRSINHLQMQQMLNVNVNSVIQTLSSFSNRNYTNDNSSIVLLSSVSAISGEKGGVGYSAAKGAMNSIVKSSAAELAQRQIRVNSIMPGIVETDMSKDMETRLGEEYFKQLKNKHLLGMGKPEDIAYCIGYLLSPASRWVTGTNIIIDGGYTL